MADHHQGKTGGHCGAGYAVVGHPAKPGPDRNADRGHCFAASVLCGPDGAGVYPAAAGRGNRRCKAKRSEIWEKAYGTTERSGIVEKAVATWGIIRKSGGKTAWSDA